MFLEGRVTQAPSCENGIKKCKCFLGHGGLYALGPSSNRKIVGAGEAGRVEAGH